MPSIPKEFNHLLLHKWMVKRHRYLACYFLPTWERGQCNLSQETCILKACHKPNPLLQQDSGTVVSIASLITKRLLLWSSAHSCSFFSFGFQNPFYSVIMSGLMHWKNNNASILKRDNNVLPSCLQDNELQIKTEEICNSSYVASHTWDRNSGEGKNILRI